MVKTVAKRQVMRIALALALLLAASGFVGCGSNSTESSSDGSSTGEIETRATEPVNCVVIAAVRANSSLSVTYKNSHYVQQAYLSSGKLHIVKLDGDPESVYDEQQELEAKSDNKIKEEMSSFYNKYKKAIAATKAEVAEIDFEKAFRTADNELSDDDTHNGKRKNVVVVLGTGLSTTGVIDFTSKDYLSDTSELDAYAEWIKKTKQLGSYDNIDKVVWYDFKAVASPQEEFPDDTSTKALKSFYKDILEDAGVGEVEFATDGKKGEASEGLPHVSTVKMPAKQTYASGDKETLVENEDGFEFKPDTAEFVDGTSFESNEKITRIVSAIKGSNLKLKLTGYTAHYDTNSEGGNEGLSKARAEALKQVLVDMGCPEDSITTVGGGFGPYDDDQANRCVVVEFE